MTVKLYFATDGSWGNADNLLLLELSDADYNEASEEIYTASDAEEAYGWAQSHPGSVNIDDLE